MSVPNNQINYANTTLELEAGYESLSIPVSFGLSLSTDEHGDNIIPLKNALHQNYPNPFNPTTPYLSILLKMIKLDYQSIMLKERWFGHL